MNENLEMYLTQVAQQLRGLPPQQRESELREIESHLSAMIEARKADGDFDVKAVDDALLQFGTAWHIGRDLTYAYQQQRTEPLLRALAAGVVALGCQYTLMSFFQWGALFLHTTFWVGPSPLSFELVWRLALIMGCSLFVTPFLSGLIASRVAPRRGWWMALMCYAMVALVSSCIAGNAKPLAVALVFVPGLLAGAWLGARKQPKKPRFALT